MFLNKKNIFIPGETEILSRQRRHVDPIQSACRAVCTEQELNCRAAGMSRSICDVPKVSRKKSFF